MAGTLSPPYGAAAGGAPLPPLRQDLRLSPGAGNRWGEPLWVIHDPLQHRFHQINGAARAMLAVWQAGLTAGDIARLVEERHGLVCDPADVAGLVEFCRANDLLAANRPGQWRELAERAERTTAPAWRRVLHGYLFFRVPLLRPQAFLEVAAAVIEPVLTWWTAAIVGLLGLAGLYLTSRQWDAFRGTFHDFATWEGAASFGCTLLVIKACHELGHALTAVRFGCRVPTMGVAFMVLTPLLYTDVTDAWRLPRRRQRLLIDAAGLLVELAIACLATFLWAFLPDGPWRAIAFMAATSAWLVSLAVNASPFMRFDGYYLLCDLIGVDNLQPRAFALARWQVRRLLLAPGLPCPEPLPGPLRRLVILYGWAVWLYRLVVFTGLALLVYAMFFKALGIVLFTVEIWFFVLAPIVNEIRQWPTMNRQHLSPRRAAVSLSLAALLALAVAVPWSTRVEVPAVLEASRLVQVFPPEAGRIVSVAVLPGQHVQAGDLLVLLGSPALDAEIRAGEIRLAATRLRLAVAIAGAADREQRLVLVKDLESLTASLAGMRRLREQLAVRAPVGGRLVELAADLPAGRWIGKPEMIALIAGDGPARARGYLAEADLARLAIGSRGRFVPDDLTLASLPVRLERIADAGAATLELAALASVHGGRVASELDAHQRAVPVGAEFQVELAPEEDGTAPAQTVRGVVVLAGERESLAARVWRQIAKVLIRESGF